MGKAILDSGIELEYELYGEGEPLILISGVTNQLVHWPEAFVHEIAAKGFQVIRFDNRDVGHSTKFVDSECPSLPTQIFRFLLGLQIDSPYTLGDMADDVVGLMDHLELPSCHVLGLSMGGMIAQVLAINHSQRVRSLGLIMTSPGGLYMPQIGALRALISSPSSTDESSLLAHDFYVSNALATLSYPADEVQCREMFSAARQRDPVQDSFVRQFAAILASPSRHEALGNLTQPTVVIHGDSDPLIPVQAGIDIANSMPEAKLHLLENVGHSMPRVLWSEVIELITNNALGIEEQSDQDQVFERLAA